MGARSVTCLATYENGVLRLSQSLELPERSRVRVRIESVPDEDAPADNVLQQLLALASDLGVDDLAEQHDHYLYGIEKR